MFGHGSRNYRAKTVKLCRDCLRANFWGNILYNKQNSYNYDIENSIGPTYIPTQGNRQLSF